jgi:Fe-S cluster biogenesis protein NfuA
MQGDALGASADLKRRVESALEEVRPFLREDGGDIELVNIADDGVVDVRFLGACADCSLAIMTLRAGVERIIQLKAPEIRRIEMTR